jgi:hypothetical protein
MAGASLGRPLMFEVTPRNETSIYRTTTPSAGLSDAAAAIARKASRGTEAVGQSKCDWRVMIPNVSILYGKLSGNRFNMPLVLVAARHFIG